MEVLTWRLYAGWVGGSSSLRAYSCWLRIGGRSSSESLPTSEALNLCTCPAASCSLSSAGGFWPAASSKV